MTFVSYIFPYEKLLLESRLQQSDIMTRMNWLITQSSGIAGSGGIRGYLTGPNMFVLETSYMQFGGVVDGNCTNLTIRMKPGKRNLFFILLGLAFLSAIALPLMEPSQWPDSTKVIGSLLVLYAVYVIIMKKQVNIVRDYLLRLLESQLR